MFFKLLLTSTLIFPALSQYTLNDDYSGPDFLQSFSYFSSPDPTHGYVNYLDRTTSFTSSLVGVIPSQNDTVYLGLDTSSPSGPRGSVRLTSNKAYNHGLFVADIAHMPGGGCGTWPALWLLGPEWPNGGEIDIFEGVNDQTTNHMTLHTSPECRIAGMQFTGQAATENCDVNAEGQAENAGCAIYHPDQRSYGTAFNQAGGGVYVTEWNSTAISIWFFSRDSIPADITNSNPQPATWGLPAAQFGGNACDVEERFKDMNIVINTSLCGDWAGNVWSQNSVCNQKAPTCDEYIDSNPEELKEAYWGINYIKVYEEGL